MPFKIDRLRELLAKIETTAGTAISVTGTDGTVPVMNAVYNDNTSYNRRENATGGKLAGRRGPLIGTMSFDVEAMGLGATGSVPAWADLFLPPCGFVKSTATFTYTRTVANQKTITLKHFIDGKYRQLYGAAGSCRLTYNAGNISLFSFNFTGIVSPIAETANPAVTLVTTQPIVGAASFTYHNGTNPITLNAPSGVIDWGQTVAPIETPNAAGYLRFCVSDYNPIMTVEPYEEAVGSTAIDPDADWVANSERAISLVLGSSANNTMTIAASKATHSSAPSWGERQRLVTRGFNLDFNDDSAPTIVFS